MELRKGIAVSPGITIGPAFVLDTEEIRIPQRFIEKENVEGELQRFDEAIRSAHKTINVDIEQVGNKIGVGSQILEIHKQLLSDPVLLKEVHGFIADHQYTAEYAVSRVINRYIKKFKGVDSPIIQERIPDLYDVERLILNTLLGGRVETLKTLESEVIVIARNLTPAQTAALNPSVVLGFATDLGGKTSHTAIMARALGIPAVVALENVSTTVLGGDIVIIDGFRGVVLINPDPKTIETYQEKAQNVERTSRRIRKQVQLPSETIDGYPIDLQANIELPTEVHVARDFGASGIGLYRTEFIHMQNPKPDEELHFDHYSQVIKELDGRELTIRTLDLGGDKFSDSFVNVEENPFLGCRSIRYCFAHPDIFVAQLRAIFRASALGPIRMMLPMIGSLREIEQALVLIEQVKEELRAEGVAHNGDIPLGIMIEIPSSALIADVLAPRVKFFSIGTNDLVQYSLAVDRGNQSVAGLYDPVHPAVLRLMVETLRAGDKAGIPVSLCGEMATETLYIPLLIGLGMRSLSVSPHLLPEVKQVIRSISVGEANRLARRCLALPDGSEIVEELTAWNREHLPSVGYMS